MGHHPRDEREWKREVERRLAMHGSALSGVTGVLTPVVDGRINDIVGKQPTAPIELVAGTSVYLNSRGVWRGRFTLDFPDVTVDVNGAPIQIAWYELQGQSGGMLVQAGTDSAPTDPVRYSATAKANPPRVKIGNGSIIAPAPARATARTIYPMLRSYDGGAPYVQVATSNTSSLRVDDLEPGSQWVFRARAMGVNSVTPGQWSATVSITILKDTLAPQQLTKPVATVSRGTITVTWDGNAVTGQLPADFKYAELAHGTDASPTEIVARFNDAGGFTVISDIPYFDPQFFRIRAVDESGNAGPWSAQEVAYVTPLVDEDIILSTIDAAQTLLINVDANVSILSNTILTRHLVVTEDMTVALLAAHKIVAGDIEANAVTTDKLVAGAVTASKLTSTLVLTSKIIAGEEFGTHAQMDENGFRVFADDPTDGIPNEVVRMGVASTDDYFAISRADGSLAATISQDGIGSFKEVNANEALYYKGSELQSLLDKRPKGNIMSAYRTTNSANNAVSGGPYLPYLRMEVTLEANHIYRFLTSGIRLDTDANTTGTIAAGFAAPNVIATENNVSLFTMGHVTGGNNGGRGSPTLSELWAFVGPAGETRVYSFIILYGVTSGAGQAGIRADGANPVRMMIDDLGTPPTPNGTWLDSVAPPPPPPPAVQNYYTEWGCYNSANYDGAGNRYTFNDSKMFQGLSPAGYGNLKSIGLFGDMTGALAGSTVTNVRVYFNFNHWYYNSGGTARIGVHGHTGIPGTDWGRGPLTAISGGWPKPGARWVDLSSGHFNGFKTGEWKGVYLEGDGTYGTYGYADRPVIGISYSK